MITNETILASFALDNKGLDSFTRLSDKEKIILTRMIVKDLSEIEHERGHEHLIEVWSIVQRKMATTFWLGKCGPFALWKSMLRQVNAKIIQDRKGISRNDELKQMAQGIFK